ncbi:MAG: hypothetical protein AAGF98_04005 [Cyanobacteria bacterium P01_H01_bin.153]
MSADRLTLLLGLTCCTALGLGTGGSAQAAIADPDALTSTDQTATAKSQKSSATELIARFKAVQPDAAASTPAVDLLALARIDPQPLPAHAAAVSAAPQPTKQLAVKPSTEVSTTVSSHFQLAAATTSAPAEVPAIAQAADPAATVVLADAVIEAAAPEPIEVRAIAQTPTEADAPATDADVLLAAEPEAPLTSFQPLLQFQAASIFQDDELSGRLRASAIYAFNEQVLVGATVDLVGGDAFVDSADTGLSLNELYVSAAPFIDLPNLRFVGGLMDLTSYFDRNSFAKDVVTHFFNPVFQTNPALSAAGINSRPTLLVNWSATDQLELKAASFSSSRDLGELALDGFAGEVGFRSGNFILRGTVATARDAGDDNGFEEIFQIQRSDGSFGLQEDDREVAYGLNAEYFIDSINLGLFGRVGWYENQDVERSGTTFSLGTNALDVFLAGDRLGLGYGRLLSNGDLQSGKAPDVWEVFYDAPVYANVRAGVSLQSREEFSDTFLGLRVRADW